MGVELVDEGREKDLLTAISVQRRAWWGTTQARYWLLCMHILYTLLILFFSFFFMVWGGVVHNKISILQNKLCQMPV